MMEKVVELSKPVEISSMNNARVGPTIISPVQENTHTKETKKDRMLCVYSSQVAMANHMLKYKYCKKTHVMGDDVSSTSITLLWALNWMTTWYPVKLESNPGSSKKALQQIELTTTSYNEAQTWCKKLDIITFIPVVTRFLWPPEIPRCRSSPTIVSAHTSRPNTCSSNWKVKMAPPVHELSHLGRIIKP